MPIYKLKEILKERIMGLAAPQLMQLTLTNRKGTIERNIAVDAARKMLLTREMSQLSSEYQQRLSNKNIAFFANGQYSKINYNYIMGYGQDYFAIINNTRPLKSNAQMILTDWKGQVVMSDTYANAILSAVPGAALNNNGVGPAFDEDYIPAILAALCPNNMLDEEAFRNGIAEHTWSATVHNTLSGEVTGSTNVNTADYLNEKIQEIINFYYPIFQAAANNGWTTEYNQFMTNNDDYVSDSLTSGTFQLASVNEYGQYDPEATLTYFITAGEMTTRTDSDTRQEITAWYEAEKQRISEKESFIDIDMENLKTELDAINAEMESIKTFIDDAIKVFNWGG